MKKLIFLLLTTLFATSASALELPDSKEAAIEVTLKNGKIVWVHGSHRGAYVTKDGKAAPPGVYASKDGNLRFKVDHLGHLTHDLHTKYEGAKTVEKTVELNLSDLVEDDDDINEILG